MIVVVGGQARKVGKTRAVCDIVAATRAAGWTAVKISPHEHDGTSGGDTQRYLEAGAAAAHLLAPGDALPSAANLIVESNAVVDTLTPDLFVFVTEPDVSEWKESAQHVIGRADVVVERHVTTEVLDRIREALSAARR